MHKNMRICFLPLGNIRVRYDDLVRPNAEAEKSSRTAEIPTWAVYIEHPEARLLFDTGQKFLTEGERSNDRLLKQLSLCGVAPPDIDYVIMSHLHNDHAGKIGLFSNAQVVVQRQELADALVESHTGDPNGIYHREDVDVQAKWKLVDGRYQLFNGIDLIPFPGHTRGLQGMLLSLEHAGKFLIASDACYSSENYGPPVRLSGVATDDELSVKSVEKIREIAGEHHAKIIFGHDLQQFHLLKKAPFFYD